MKHLCYFLKHVVVFTAEGLDSSRIIEKKTCAHNNEKKRIHSFLPNFPPSQIGVKLDKSKEKKK